LTLSSLILARLVGGIQCFLGTLSSVLAYLVYASQPLRESLGIAGNEISFFIFLFMVFGVFSIVSGMILINRD
jgi:hypothetical protein